MGQALVELSLYDEAVSSLKRGMFFMILFAKLVCTLLTTKNWYKSTFTQTHSNVYLLLSKPSI